MAVCAEDVTPAVPAVRSRRLRLVVPAYARGHVQRDVAGEAGLHVTGRRSYDGWSASNLFDHLAQGIQVYAQQRCA